MTQGLPKQPITIPFGSGLETDVDPKLLPLGKTVIAENQTWGHVGVPAQAGELVKRPGNTPIGGNYISVVSPGALAAPWQLATHKGALVSFPKSGPIPIAIYSPKIDQWDTPIAVSTIDAANAPISHLRTPVLPTRSPVFRAGVSSIASNEISQAVQNPDYATNGTWGLTAWVEFDEVDNTASIESRIVELATKKVVFTWSIPVNPGGEGSSPVVRCCYANTGGLSGPEFQIAYTDGSNIVTREWLESDLNAGDGNPSAGTVVATDFAGSYLDFIGQGLFSFIVYGATSKLEVIQRTNFTNTGPFEIKTASAVSITAGAFSIFRDLGNALPDSQIAIVHCNGNGWQVQWGITPSFLPSASYVIDAGVTNIVRTTGHTISTNNTGEFIVLGHIFSPGSAPLEIGRRTVADGISHQIWIRDVALASQPFSYASDFYVTLCYESNTQGTFFVLRVPTNLTDGIDMTRTPVARFATGQAPEQLLLTPGSVIPAPNSTTAFGMALAVETRLVETAQNTTFPLFETGVDLVTVTFLPQTGSCKEFADSLYVPGGVLGAYDGRTFAEDGFHLAPEPPALTGHTGGALTLLAQYFYVTVFRYIDNNGRLHRSAPSTAGTTTLVGSQQSIAVVQRTLKLHGRPGQLAVEFYRASLPAAGAAQDYHLVAVMLNDETAETITFTDQASDTAAAKGESLYTNGVAGASPLPTEPPPPALAIATYKDRLAIVSSEDPSLIWVSLPLIETEGPRWSSQSTIRIDDAFGDLTAIGAVDDKLIPFKGNAVYAVLGDGPDLDGNGTFGQQQFVAQGLGIRPGDARSLVETEDGLMFRGSSDRSGIYLVNRGLAADYIGAPVQAYIGETIVDGVHLPSLDRVEYFTASGRTLVYDKVLKVWTTYTNQSAVAATVYLGHHAYWSVVGGSYSKPLVEDQTGTVWEDDGVQVDQFALSPIISFAGLKGYGRIYRTQGVGVTLANHTVTATLLFDGSSTPTVTKSLDILLGTDWMGWELAYSTKKSMVQIGIRVSKRVADLHDGAGAKISAAVFTVGMHEGLRKIASTQRLT